MPPRKKLSQVLADDGNNLIQSGKEPQTIFETMLKEEAVKQAEQESKEIGDDEKPPLRGYNSALGTLTLTKGNQTYTYHHGEIMPDGKTAYCPKLTFFEHVKTYTRLTKYHDEVDPTTKQVYSKKVDTPLELYPPQLDVVEDIIRYDAVLILLHRDLGKSVIGLEYCKEQAENWGKTITYISKSGPLSIDYCNAIRHELMTNPRIKRDYGYLLDDEHGNAKDKMFFLTQRNSASKEPGLCFGSSDGKSTLGGHPDIIMLDDPVDDDAANSASERKRLSRWFWKAIYPMLTPQSKLIVIGTMKHPQDLYNEIIKRDIFKVIKYPAILEWPNFGQANAAEDDSDINRWSFQRTIVEDKRGTKQNMITGVKNIIGGKVYFNEFFKDKWTRPGRVIYHLDDDPAKEIDKTRMALQEFLLIRQAQGPAFFQSEYQLEAVNVEEGYLKLKNMWGFTFNKLDRPTQDDLNQNITAFYDQAFGTQNKSDWNAIVVVSKSMMGSDLMKYYIRAIEVWKMGGIGKKIGVLRTLKQRFPKLEFIGIDAGQINAADTKYIEENCPEIPLHPIFEQQLDAERERLGITIEKVKYDLSGVKPGKQTKCRRILNQLDTKMFNCQIGIASDIGADGLMELNSEGSFPFCDEFDVMDALGMAIELADRFNSATDFFWRHG
jgi:hypothetical protein